MKCVMCGVGELSDGTTTVTLEEGDATLVLKGVPALVCDNCGDEFLDSAVCERLDEYADALAASEAKLTSEVYQRAA